MGNLSDPILQYKQNTRKKISMIVICVVLCAVVIVCDIIIGSYNVTGKELLYTLTHPADDSVMAYIIVWSLRLPPALTGILAGFALALAGATMQTILNNPLATPYTLGVSSGAGVGAYFAIVIGVSSLSVLGRYMMPVFAFVFALIACLSIYSIAKIKNFTSSVMVLAGIGMNFLFSAAQTLMQYAASAEELQTARFWLFGSLNRTKWTDLAILLPIVVVCFIYIYLNSWNLTAMQLGDAKARSLGISVEKLRMRMFIAISLLTATTVAFVGTIGFIGLVGPHIARMLVGEDQRFFLPMSCVSGSLILSAAGLVARTIVPGRILPVGVLTSLLGVPFFFLLILRKKRSMQDA
jgi:iron complex transport system permease protein